MNGRLTCRDEEGRARLMPGANLVDVIEALCRIEERGCIDAGLALWAHDMRPYEDGRRRIWPM